MPEAVTAEAVEAAVVADSEAALSAVAAEVDTVEAVEAAVTTVAMAVETMVALEVAVEVDSVVETAEAAVEAVDVAATTATKTAILLVNAPSNVPKVATTTAIRQDAKRKLGIRKNDQT
jgi:hypothetical protein